MKRTGHDANDRERVAVTPNERQNTRTQSIRTSYDVALAHDSHLTLKLWDYQRRYQFRDPDSFLDTETHQSTKGAEAQVDLPLGLTVGGNFIHDRENSIDNVTTSQSFIRSVENWSVFAQDTMRWNLFTLIPSGRFDHHSQFGHTANPRVQLMADATDWLRFSGSAARAFRSPTIDELYYPFTDFGTFFGTDFQFSGNPNLQPEKAWTYDAGIELHKDANSLKVSYFRANVSNLIQSVDFFTPGTPNVDQSTSINVGKARRQGAEIQVDHRVNDYWKNALNYTYLNNRGVPPGFTNYVNLRYSPRHTVNYIAMLTPFKNLEWDHTLRYVGSRFSDNNNGGAKLGSMVVWDMRLAYKWSQVDGFLQVADVTNRRYEEQSGYPLPGRTFYGGVAWHYE